MSRAVTWADPAVEEVVSGIYRIPLPMPNDGLRAVNVYLLRGPDGVTLIDGGWWIPEAFDRLQDAFDQLEVKLDELASVLVTHFHRDHYTLGVQLRRLTGCDLALGIGERESVQAIIDGVTARQTFAPVMRRAGFVGLIGELLSESDGDPGTLYELPSRWLRDGDVVAAASHELRALSTPGHTQGHLCFADATASVLFAGDHVLPHITPSIGFETVPSHLPLGDYLSSLAVIRSRPDTPLLPAHGPATGSVHARIDELLEHHAARLTRCGDAVATGSRTAFEVAQALTWTRHDRALDELDPFNQLLAVHETLAHLDVLVVQGRLRGRTVMEVDEFDTGTDRGLPDAHGRASRSGGPDHPPR
jgi:glyoxylase-like metal-dependent hydrolase (beta-lactamase superfamily II)